MTNSPGKRTAPLCIVVTAQGPRRDPMVIRELFEEIKDRGRGATRNELDRESGTVCPWMMCGEGELILVVSKAILYRESAVQPLTEPFWCIVL